MEGIGEAKQTGGQTERQAGREETDRQREGKKPGADRETGRQLGTSNAPLAVT